MTRVGKKSPAYKAAIQVTRGQTKATRVTRCRSFLRLGVAECEEAAVFSFFGAKPLLVDQVIFYSRRSDMYSYDPVALAGVIADCKRAKDFAALQQILRELFWICNQGRRPWSLDAEQNFLALAAEGSSLLEYLRRYDSVDASTYEFIDPLSIALRLEYEADHLDEGLDDGQSAEILDLLHRLTHIYLVIYDRWTTDHPQMAALPSADSMRHLLEMDDDVDFKMLLTAFARTSQAPVKQMLLGFCEDDEPAVQVLARGLLDRYF